MTEKINKEDFKRYYKAFESAWTERSKGRNNHSGESTVEGPLKMADNIAEVYFKGL